VASDPHRRRFERGGHAAIGIVLSVITLLALPTAHFRQSGLHLRSVHYGRWVEGNAFAASDTSDSANTPVSQSAATAGLVGVELDAEPKPLKDVAIEPSVPPIRLLLRFKLSPRSSNDSDPFL
jgi:hypothetical protein